MGDLDTLSPSSMETALQAKTLDKIVPLERKIQAPHFVFYVQDYLAEHYGEKSLQEGGLKVYTTLDTRLQKIAEDAIESGVDRNSKKYNAYNGALVAIDPKTGKILAMVGSRNYFAESYPKDCKGSDCQLAPNVNAATAALQPGSSFKPYVYLTAFDEKHKYGPGTPLFDVETNFGTTGNGKDYIPKKLLRLRLRFSNDATSACWKS
jgi:membrane peptidoglycan carboxypeptidase